MRSKFPGSRILYVSLSNTVSYVIPFEKYALCLRTANIEGKLIMCKNLFEDFLPDIVVYDGVTKDNIDIVKASVGYLQEYITFMQYPKKLSQTLLFLISSQQVSYRDNSGQHNMTSLEITNAWKYEDYDYCFLRSNIWKKYGKTLGLEDNITFDKLEEYVKDKYFYAGYNPRYMLEYTIPNIISSIETKVRTLPDDGFEKMINSQPGNEEVINHLVIREKGNPKPSSLYVVKAVEYANRSEHSRCKIFGSFVRFAEGTTNHSLLGWIFENEVTTMIKNTTKDVIVFHNSNDAEVEFYTPASGRLGIISPSYIEFEDHAEFINVLVSLCKTKNCQGGVWMFPKKCRNPFYDGAYVNDISDMEDIEGMTKVVLDTFQITISETHTCYGESLLKICQILRDEYQIYVEVTHHALLPKLEMLKSFTFNSPTGTVERYSLRYLEKRLNWEFSREANKETQTPQKRAFESDQLASAVEGTVFQEVEKGRETIGAKVAEEMRIRNLLKLKVVIGEAYCIMDTKCGASSLLGQQRKFVTPTKLRDDKTSK